ncbi:MAG: hypothetical protein ACK4RK_16830 [Gemmataceae bacterium]
MSLDDVKKRFVEEIKLRAYDDQYVDKDEEREILQIAIQQGISVDSARAALSQVCDQQGYVLESAALRQIKDLIDTFAGNDGKVDEKEYKDAVTTLMKATKGKRTELQCRRMVLQVIDDNAYKVKTGMFSNWYSREKKDVGLA